MKYKVINKSGLGTWVQGDDGALHARNLPCGTVFEATAQRAVAGVGGKPIRDDARHRQQVKTWLVMITEGSYKGLREFAYTVQSGVRYAVPYTPPVAPPANVSDKPTPPNTSSDLEARIAALELAVFDEDGDGIVTEEERAN